MNITLSRVNQCQKAAVARRPFASVAAVNAAGIITLGNQVIQVGSPLAGQRDQLTVRTRRGGA
jgi:hypothetical protein